MKMTELLPLKVYPFTFIKTCYDTENIVKFKKFLMAYQVFDTEFFCFKMYYSCLNGNCKCAGMTSIDTKA